MAKYLQVRNNGEITLPTSMLRKANLKAGDLLKAIVESDGSIRLVPKSGVEKVIENQQLKDVDWAAKQKSKKPAKK